MYHRLVRFSLPVVLMSALLVGCKQSTTVSTSTGTTNTTSNSNTTESAEAAPAEVPVKEKVKSNYDESVVRHAVFFSFKETSTKEDIQGVADAFAGLPNDIPEIIDFQWGENNSPEEHDNGFTHCFLLTFADEAGRDVYLPHEAHKAFGDVLRPHMADVFVIDYFGKAGDAGIKKELKHCVFFKFADDASATDVKKVEDAFADLPNKIDVIKHFEWGKNHSPEKHDDGFTHCFMVTFDSEEGREAYLPHADHMAFVDVLKPVLDKVRVLDFWETK